MGKWSFRASEARPGIQDFKGILDSGFRRNDGLNNFCNSLKSDIEMLVYEFPKNIFWGSE
jgi:hypothetical protein